MRYNNMNGMRVMRRTTMLLLLLAATAASTACGDPIVVLGESPNTVRNVVGIGDSTGNRIDTLATHSRFLTLTAATFDDASNLLFVADRGATRTVNGITTRLARLFSVTSAARLDMILDGGGCSSGGICLVEATAMTRGSGNSLVIADAIGNRVVRFDPASHTFTVVAGDGTAANATEGSSAQTGSINAPAGVLRASDGTLYVSERGGGRVLSIGADGSYHVVAGGGTATASTNAVAATSISMGGPTGLALIDGVLYIADREFNSVYAVTLATGTLVRVAGSGISGFSGDGGIATEARLATPTDLAIGLDPAILYVADTGNNRVRTVNLLTGIINTYMGSGDPRYNGDHIAAGAISLKTPVDLATSALGFLFVVDQGHAVVRRATTAY
jgi:sugar lactone lactonase YvrE